MAKHLGELMKSGRGQKQFCQHPVGQRIIHTAKQFSLLALEEKSHASELAYLKENIAFEPTMENHATAVEVFRLQQRWRKNASAVFLERHKDMMEQFDQRLRAMRDCLVTRSAEQYNDCLAKLLQALAPPVFF